MIHSLTIYYGHKAISILCNDPIADKVTVIDMQMLICNYLYISSLCYTYNFHYAKFVYDSVQFDSKSFKVFTQQKLVCNYSITAFVSIVMPLKQGFFAGLGIRSKVF